MDAAAPQPALLERFPLMRTADLDEAREVVGRAFCDHRLELRPGARLRAAQDHVAGRGVSLNALAYGGEVAIDPGELGGFYLLQIPLAGAARIEHRGETVDAGPARASLLNPDRTARMVWGAGCRKLLLQVDRAHLESVAEDMLGGPLPGPVRFAPAVDLARPEGRRLRERVLAAARAAGQGALWSGAAGLREGWAERALAADLLMLQPSNVSHMLWRTEDPPRERAVRRAVAYMHAHLAEAVRIEDVAAEAGLTMRALQIGFRRSVGLSPKQYLCALRLDAARYRLSRRQDREAVGEVALACGFSHLGRFAQAYRARFGELPSAAG